MSMRAIGRPRMLAMSAFLIAAVLSACGEGEGAAGGGESEVGRFSVATGIRIKEADLFLTEADAGTTINTPTFIADIGDLDKKGVMLTLEGDDASSLRWRFAEKPDPFLVEWYGVDDRLAFETDGLIGDPATATKVLEFRPSKIGETTFMLELVEQDPTKRTEPPVKRLEFTFSVCYEPAQVITSGGGASGASGQQPPPLPVSTC